MLYGIDRIVQSSEYYRRQEPPHAEIRVLRAVIMHDQIVNPGDIIIRENDVVNLLYQFRLGGCPETEGTDRVFGCDKSGVQDEHTRSTPQ